MADLYFQKFPLTSYANTTCIDITRRVAVLSAVFRDPYAFYTYVVKEGERPDHIAERYYGSSSYAWLIYLGMGAIDPYFAWPLDSLALENFLDAKYGSIENAQRLITGWRLDWDGHTEEELSQGGFDALPQPLKKYYAAVYGPGEKVQVWKRRRQDWEASTNMIVTWLVPEDAGFVANEIIRLKTGNTEFANATVSFSNSSVVVVQHVFGDVTVANTTLVGDTSNASVSVTGFSFTSNSIPIDERTFWSPVYAYDRETEANEQRKHINLIDAKYAATISNELRKDLAS